MGKTRKEKSFPTQTLELISLEGIALSIMGCGREMASWKCSSASEMRVSQD
jgi:hypothetical protein